MSADDEQVNNWHHRLNGLLRSIASQNVAIWQHIVRRPENKYPDGEFPEGFAADLNEKYAARVSGELLMVNELYLTVVYRPQPSMVGKALWSLVSSGNAEACAQERAESIDALERWCVKSNRHCLVTTLNGSGSMSTTACILASHWSSLHSWS
ncbi:hypothetical protein MRX60_12550, partial (plasmid) [Xylella fastidiosa subsp. pauca]|nr:hypothetical protein [Xylella fastidiosa subsp. pauca]